MTRLRPFFSYFGSKWNMAPHYPAPEHDTIVEPFAGSACYSLLYPDMRIFLMDANPVVVGIWEYLIGASERDILRLPVEFDKIDDLRICQEAKWLIGLSIMKGTDVPAKSRSAWARNPEYAGRQFWSEARKEMVASQLDAIRHWRVKLGSYETLWNSEATWFIDPPYQKARSKYQFNSIDYEALAGWCADRRGQVIVCESEGADWMPFASLRVTKALAARYISEVVWTNEGANRWD